MSGPLKPPPAALTLREVLVEEYKEIGALPDGYAGRLSAADALARSEGRCAEAAGLRSLYGEVHRGSDDNPLSALCLSGGGIRSATFGLGVLQGLARHGLLRHFHYLSTVSGGGYIGGWLTAWMHRHKDGPDGVFKELKGGESHYQSSCAPEPAEIKHLREYSNYLTPRLGGFSIDTWTLVATYLRNLLLNWVVLIPLLAAILLLPRLYAAAMWLVPDVDRPYQILILALWVPAIVFSVAWLPSRTRPKNGVRPGTAGGDAETRSFKDANSVTIFWLIILPILVSCLLSSLRWAWAVNKGGGIPWGRVLWLSPAIYILAGALAVGLCRWRRSANPPNFLRVAGMLGFIGVVTALITCASRIPPVIYSPSGYVRAYTCLAFPLLIAQYLLTITLYVGLTSRSKDPDADDDREWWGRVMGCFCLWGGIWMVVASVAMYGPALFEWFSSSWQSGALFGTVAAAAGFVGMLGGYSTSSGERRGRTISWRRRLVEFIPTLSAHVFVVAFLILLSAGINHLLAGSGMSPSFDLARKVVDPATGKRVGLPPVIHPDGREAWPGRSATFSKKVENLVDLSKLRDSSGLFGSTVPPISREERDRRESLNSVGWPAFLKVAALTGSLAVVALIAGSFMNVNRLSLHAIYRNRLIRAYLGASNSQRKPHPFTGFDPEDNMPMHHLRRAGRFTEKDLLDPPSVARVLVDRETPLGIYSRRQMGEPAAAEVDKLLDELAEDGGPEVQERLKDLALKYLNRLLKDPHLAQGVGLTNPEGSPEILKAIRQLRSDGCPTLLNRLILELECAARRVPGVPSEQWKQLLSRGARPPRPFHVVNLALNLLRGKSLAWQQRKAASFTVTPLHSGFEKGYRPSVDYACGITLGTAVAISGAAASPNMGYHSSPAVTFLMALFNARLGWWFGNPACTPARGWWAKFCRMMAAFPWRDPMPSTTYHLPYPRHSLRPLIDEALGRTNDENEYVYLSDGGHFENIGLYEMVRRRCRVVVVSDATCDPKCGFDDMANAIRKVRTDFGIPIDILDHSFITSRPQDKTVEANGRYCAVGTIRYAAVDGEGTPDGLLVYFKPALRKGQPVDVYNYSRSSDAFPHEPTSDQWFSESQFESYRRLGEETVDALFHPGNVSRAEGEFVRKAGKEAGAAREALKAVKEGKPLLWLHELAAAHVSQDGSEKVDATGPRAAEEARASAEKAEKAAASATASADAAAKSQAGAKEAAGHAAEIYAACTEFQEGVDSPPPAEAAAQREEMQDLFQKLQRLYEELGEKEVGSEVPSPTGGNGQGPPPKGKTKSPKKEKKPA